MATKQFIYLTYLDALNLHLEAMQFHGETRFGVFDGNLIESALARPKHAAVYENADVIRQAATLCLGLVKNHPWRGGNKRTATHITETFLRLNGCTLEYELIEMVEMVLAVEADRWKVDEIENWLRERIRKIE